MFDCCADKDNSKCLYWSDDFEMVNDVPFVAWMNPPFSKAWKMFEHFFKVVKKGVAIYRCDNFETRIWQEIIFKDVSWIFIPSGRVSYTPFEVGNIRNGTGTRFPSALIGLNIDPPKNLNGVLLRSEVFKE